MTVSSYGRDSVLLADDAGPLLALATALAATPSGLVEHPTFFDGFVAHPAVAAAGLLTVADVAATRYVDLSALARRSLDPVVTASGDRLRFESLSGCNRVYARLDLLADGIDAGEVGYGTTNVDVNPPLRDALTGMRRTELLHLAVGTEGLTASTLDATHRNDRWTCPGAGCAGSPRCRSWPRACSPGSPCPARSRRRSSPRSATTPPVRRSRWRRARVVCAPCRPRPGVRCPSRGPPG